MKNTDLKQEQLHWKYLEEQKCWFLGKIVYCDNPENSSVIIVFSIAVQLFYKLFGFALAGGVGIFHCASGLTRIIHRCFFAGTRRCRDGRHCGSKEKRQNFNCSFCDHNYHFQFFLNLKSCHPKSPIIENNRINI